MGRFVEIGGSDELKEGTMREVMVEGRKMLLARIGDVYHAAENRCPHMGGALSQGKLEGTIVTCPKHGSQFDLSDGGVVRWLRASGLISKVSRALKSPRPLVIYRVKVEGDRIMVEI